LEQAEAERQELLARIGQLQEEVRGLELAVARHQGSTLVATPRQNGWMGIPRTTAIERIMRELAVPLAPIQIAQALRERGRTTDKPAYVSAALAYLKTKGTVLRTDEGWIIARGESAERQEGPRA
jgi:hypothetical protein